MLMSISVKVKEYTVQNNVMKFLWKVQYNEKNGRDFI